MVAARTPNGRNGAGIKERARVVPLRRRSAPKSPPDFLFTERSDAYMEELRNEAAFWDRCSITLSSEAAPFGFQQFQNERLTGDPDRQWFQTIADYGPFRRGCVLGAGPGTVEAELLSKMPDLHLTVYDISPESLARLEARMEAEFPGRVSFSEEDLNFVTLPEGAFDLVVAHASIHHMLNLEHLAFEVNRSLASDGMFFMADRVGESLYQFADTKKAIFEDFLRTGPGGPHSKVYWPDRANWKYSPFEGIRSGDILDVFETYLTEVDRRTTSSLLELMLFVGPAAAPPGSRSLRVRIIDRLRRDTYRVIVRVFGARVFGSKREVARGSLLKQMDSLLCDSGALKPGLAFATYRKRA